MPHVLRWLLAVPVVVALACATLSAARADEAPADDSAASKAFRDAWWAETGGGNLTQALELYAKATDAEGPAAVRARALYRRAVVLQRIGKTEDAIRALDRLAKDFAGEAELLTQARARLTEWTAVDLRSSFGDWFKRYQYSPEFQAKIVDLVLKLGAQNDSARIDAERELLNIGEASVPALLEGAKNRVLAERAVKLLLQLKTVPDQVTEAFNEGWTNDQFAWKTIFALPPERRAQLAARLEAQPSPPWAPRDALRAVLAGPQEVLKWLAAPSTEPENSLRYAVLWAFVDQPGAEAFKDRLAEMIKAPGVTEYVRSNLAGALVGREWVSREQIRAWAAHSDRALRSAVWSRFAYGKSEILTPAEAWPLVVQVAKGRSNADLTSEHHLGAAFVKAVEGAPWPEALDDAADLVAAFGPPSNPSARMVEALTRAVERAPDDDATNSRLGWWSNAVPGPEGFDQLVRWTRTLPTGRRRWHAFRMLVQNRVLPQQVPQVAALLTATDLPPEERRWRWDDFFATPRTASALTDRGLVLEFFDAVSALSPQSAGEARMKMAAALAGPYARGRVPLDTLMEAWLAHPERAPFELAYQHTDLRSAIERAGQMARWRAAWREAWNRWTPEQRVMGSAILDLLGLQTDAAMTEFLHQQLRARPVSVPPRARGVVIAWLDAVELADVQAVYDLTKSDDLKEVVKFVLPSGNQPPRLKPTLEVFQAMRAGLKSEMYDGVLTGMAAAFRHIPSIQRELATALLAHPERTVHGHALEILQERASPEDEDLWIRALGDPDKDVRARAAAGMDRVPTENVKRALVKALDDPHPDVRAAALTALDSIQKQEDLKARWRERVK